jgi:hypothetical protein
MKMFVERQSVVDRMKAGILTVREGLFFVEDIGERFIKLSSEAYLSKNCMIYIYEINLNL